MLARIANKINRLALGPVERLFRGLQKLELSRGTTLELIPAPADRIGGLGTTTYGEWCYTLGLFQSLLFHFLPARTPLRALDVGCGVGRLYLALRPNMNEDDHYTGIDIGKSFVEICKRQYRDANCTFIHVDASNPFYANHLSDKRVTWPVEDGAFNLITALSVWTHLNEADWRFYLDEVGRKLAPEGKAVISFFILDDDYARTLPTRTGQTSRFYPQASNKWIFDTSAYGSADWRYPGWAEVPEVAIGVNRAAFDEAVATAGLRIVHTYSGSWKEQVGLFFQDIVVFEKA